MSDWEDLVNSEENQANLRKLKAMLNGWGDIIAKLEIRRLIPKEKDGGMDIVADENGEDPVFYAGIFSFNLTCAAAVAYYPEARRFASSPCYIDLGTGKYRELPEDWVWFFIDRIWASRENKTPIEGVYMIYQNTEHPPIPEEGQ